MSSSRFRCSGAAPTSVRQRAGSARSSEPANAQTPSYPPTTLVSDAPPPARSWGDKNPEAAARLAVLRPAVAALADEHHLPTENLLTPDTVRRVAWEPPADTSPDGIAERLRVARRSAMADRAHRATDRESPRPRHARSRYLVTRRVNPRDAPRAAPPGPRQSALHAPVPVGLLAVSGSSFTSRPVAHAIIRSATSGFRPRIGPCSRVPMMCPASDSVVRTAVAVPYLELDEGFNAWVGPQRYSVLHPPGHRRQPQVGHRTRHDRGVLQRPPRTREAEHPKARRQNLAALVDHARDRARPCQHRRRARRRPTAPGR